MNENDRIKSVETENVERAREDQLAKLLDQDNVVCAHVYDDDGYSRGLLRTLPISLEHVHWSIRLC